MNTLITLQALVDVIAAPAPTPTPAVPKVTVSAEGIMNKFATVVIPVLLAVGAAVIMGRSRNGNMSQAVTLSGINLLGLAMFALAGSMAFLGLGEFVVGLFIS